MRIFDKGEQQTMKTSILLPIIALLALSVFAQAQGYDVL